MDRLIDGDKIIVKVKYSDYENMKFTGKMTVNNRVKKGIEEALREEYLKVKNKSKKRKVHIAMCLSNNFRVLRIR